MAKSALRGDALAGGLIVLLLLGCAGGRARETRGLGREVTAPEVRLWERDVAPDGRGLPEGSGDPSKGAVVFAARCATCHANGRGLHGVATNWPYATTLFDYIRRAMPPVRARPLAADEVYAVTAFILSAENVIGRGAGLDRVTLPKVRMPGKDNFVRDDGGAMP